MPDWYGGHIPGSISVPYYLFDRLDDLPKDGTWIMAYCACPHHASGVIVAELGCVGLCVETWMGFAEARRIEMQRGVVEILLDEFGIRPLPASAR